MTKKGASDATTIGNAAAAARERLDALRREIAEAGVELEHEQARPVTPDEARARVAEAVALLRREALEGLNAGYFLAAGGKVGQGLLAELATRRVTALSLAAALDPDGLTRLLAARVEEVAGRLPEGATGPDRQRRVDGLRRRIAELERREAEALWAADAAGVDLPWRADLDPRAVLGLEPEG